MLAHIFPDQSSKLQERTDLSPKHWFKIDRQSKETAKQKILTDFDKQDEIFREFRNQFIVRQMEIVWKQHEHGTDQLTDLLDKDDYQGATFEIKKEERYNFVSSKHPEEKVNVTVGDPCFENPCSYESVEKVFDHIRDLTGLTDNSKVRQWTMLGCDGLQYTLGSRTIENVSVCQDCKMEFDEEANFKDHIKQNDHCKELSANDCRKYNNIVMIPGLGHYEINMVKVLIKLLWDIAVFDLAKMLGFHSPKALQSFQNAGDHHKSWQSLMIFMHSMAQELLVPYCRQEVKKNANPSLTGYFSYLNGATSSNYKFMSEVVFTYCLALHVFRAGIRRDNSTAIQAGKVKFSPLFFGFNMPFYMETFIRDSFVRVQCPPEVLAFIGANESYSASGHDSKREGGDFVLENINRKSKMWMPSGLPDKKKWLEVYCNIDRLDEVQDHMYNIQHLQPADDEYIFSYDLSEEIVNFLKIVRNSSYFDQRELTTLRGKPLDQELLNFINKSRAHRNDFLSQVVENNLATKKKYEPLFIKPTDRNEYFDISRRTKADIVKAVELELEGLDDEKFNKRWTKIKGKNKTDLLSFLKEIEDIKTADNSA